ncbi:hypothetical protein LINGRAHAP2_LOCUS6921 [Linum grandiflorum]
MMVLGITRLDDFWLGTCIKFSCIRRVKGTASLEIMFPTTKSLIANPCHIIHDATTYFG